MKTILVFFSSLTCLFSMSQEWISLAKNDVYNCTPTNQFIIDHYTNDIWFVSDFRASTINSNGQVFQFGTNELGDLWAGDNLNFCFTPGNVYFSKLLEGLYSFESYTRSLVFSSTEIDLISTNNDTVYTLSGTQNMFKYTPTSTTDALYGLSNVKAKNQFMYFNSGVIGRKVGINSVYLHTDPQYMIATINDFKFSRNTDTLYVSQTKGISYAYNYDFLDTITPNNTLNMPSSNVLEMEFDHLDSLWAVFGDVNDVPFAIAKLEGNTWTNVFDSSNSPIDFSNFLGLEIDTLGNLWVADNMALHTLLTPNSPSWLGLHQLDTSSKILIQPNPASESLTISGYSASFYGKQATLIDLNGKSVLEFKLTAPQHLLDVSSLKSGLYFVKIGNQTQKISIE